MAQYITDLDVSLDAVEEQSLQTKAFKKIDVDLNKGAGGRNIYLWYKKDSCSAPITRLQVTFNEDMAQGLIKAGYAKINKNLNAGTGECSSNALYLWYFKGQTEYDIPIKDIDVTTNAEDEGGKIRFGWQRLACDLNRKAGGDWIHIWMEREKQTYICDVDATGAYGSDADHFEAGYIRVDEDTNRDAGGAPVFIWYRQKTDPSGALSDLKISITHDEYQACQQQDYTPVNVDLNKGTGGNQVFLWYEKKNTCNPVDRINLLLHRAAFTVYEEAGYTVIEKNLNAGNCGFPMYLAVHNKV